VSCRENQVRDQDGPDVPPQFGPVEERMQRGLQTAAHHKFLHWRQYKVKADLEPEERHHDLVHGLAHIAGAARTRARRVYQHGFRAF